MPSYLGFSASDFQKINELLDLFTHISSSIERKRSETGSDKRRNRKKLLSEKRIEQRLVIPGPIMSKNIYVMSEHISIQALASYSILRFVRKKLNSFCQ